MVRRLQIFGHFRIIRSKHLNVNLMKPKLNFTGHLMYRRRSEHLRVAWCSVFIGALCVPALLYDIAACPVNTRETRSLEYQITCAFFKIIKTSSSDLVHNCRLAFDFRQVSAVIADKKNRFCTKYVSSSDTVYKAVSAWTLN